MDDGQSVNVLFKYNVASSSDEDYVILEKELEQEITERAVVSETGTNSSAFIKRFPSDAYAGGSIDRRAGKSTLLEINSIQSQNKAHSSTSLSVPENHLAKQSSRSFVSDFNLSPRQCSISSMDARSRSPRRFRDHFRHFFKSKNVDENDLGENQNSRDKRNKFYFPLSKSRENLQPNSSPKSERKTRLRKFSHFLFPYEEMVKPKDHSSNTSSGSGQTADDKRHFDNSSLISSSVVPVFHDKRPDLEQLSTTSPPPVNMKTLPKFRPRPESLSSQNDLELKLKRKPSRFHNDKFTIIVNKMPENCVARALYDNIAESPDELAFCKGDLLTVLEQNTAGLEGWWLCSLRGRQGICPGNRLRIIPGCYDTGSGLTSLNIIQSGTGNLQSKVHRSSSSVQHTRNQQPKKVVTPRRVGDIYTYATPSPRSQQNQCDYDVPRLHHDKITQNSSEGNKLSRSSSLHYDSPRQVLRNSSDRSDSSSRLEECQYDIPNSMPLYDCPKPQSHYDSPQHMNDSIPQGVPPRSLIIGVRGGLPAKGLGHLDGLINKNDRNVNEYDVPRSISHQPLEDNHQGDRSSKVSLMSCDSNSSSASSTQVSESLSSCSADGASSNRSSLEAHDVYDIPPEPRRFISPKPPQLPPRENVTEHQSSSSIYDRPILRNIPLEVVYDVPPQVSRDTRSSDTVDSIMKRFSSGSETSLPDNAFLRFKELHLELDSAKDTLAKLEQEVISAAEKVSSLKGTTGDGDKSTEIKLSIFRLKEALGEFINFNRGCIGNTFRRGEHKFAQKISKMLDPMESSSIVTCDAWTRLETLPASPSLASRAIAIEQLKQVASITTLLTENTRHLACVVQTNSLLVFKRSPTIEPPLSNNKKNNSDDDDKTPVQERPLPDLPKVRKEENYPKESSWIEDYDYVNLETKDCVDKEHSDILDSLPTQLRKSYDTLVKQSRLSVDSDHKKALSSKMDGGGGDHNKTNLSVKPSSVRLDPNDRQVINFYGAQSRLHLQNLNAAIDAFLLTIENNQPPKVFIAHSKFVILSAHKLVYIGDTIHRNVINAEIRTHVLNCTNALCDAMKITVASAKTAALQFPSVVAVQAMVDAFVSISHLSNNLKRAICRE